MADNVPMTKHEEIVWTHIHWRDRAQAISIARIKECSGIGERQIKEAVNGLRTRHSKLVCSSRSETDGGYYAIATADEIAASFGAMVHQAVAMIRAAKVMAPSNPRVAEMLGQIRLELGL